jgi:hypothetical protein
MDFQTAIVVLILFLAIVYLSKLAWQKVSSFNHKKNSCQIGCGKCPD